MILSACHLRHVVAVSVLFLCTKSAFIYISSPRCPPPPFISLAGLSFRHRRRRRRRRRLLREHIRVQVLHHLNHQLQAVHEGVDGHAEHAVRRGPVVDVQHLRAAVGASVIRRRREGEIPSDERRQLRVDLDGLQRDRSQAVGGKGNLELTAGSKQWHKRCSVTQIFDEFF